MTQELLFGIQVPYHVKLGRKLCQMSLGLIAPVCIEGVQRRSGPNSGTLVLAQHDLGHKGLGCTPLSPRDPADRQRNILSNIKRPSPQ